MLRVIGIVFNVKSENITNIQNVTHVRMHTSDSAELFLVPASAGRGMCYPVCGMMHIKTLTANRKE